MVEDDRDAEERDALRQRPLDERRLRQPSEPPVSSSDSAVARRWVSASAAASSVAGPPCRTVSAALTTTTRSVSTSSRATRTRGAPAGTPTSAGSAASCTAIAVEAAAQLRRDERGDLGPAARRARPPATSSVWLSVGTPSSSSASLTAAIAWRRGSCSALPSGNAGGSTTMVTRVAPAASASSGSPRVESGAPPVSPPRRRSRGPAVEGAGRARRRARTPRRGACRRGAGRAASRAREPIQRCSRRNVVRNPRFGQKRDESRFVTRQSVTITS